MNQQDAFTLLTKDFPLFCETQLVIRTKDGKLIPLKLNKAQLYAYDQIKNQLDNIGMVRKVIVKGRQQGISTLIEALCFWITIFNYGLKTFILTHESEATKNLFDMVSRYYENLPKDLKPETEVENANELSFQGIDGGYKIGTARNKGVGRSQTIQLFHGSECAFWQNADEHAAGILQSVPYSKNTYIFLESTANGIANFFYDKYKESLMPESDYELIFIPWYWQDEYIKELPEGFKVIEDEEKLKKLYKLNDKQLNWRRHKILELKSPAKFQQEYPFTAEEAFISTNFESWLDIHAVMKAARYDVFIDPVGPLIIGVDPSAHGQDLTGIAIRQGRVIKSVVGYDTKDTMEVVGMIVRLINELNPAAIFIDIIGIGVGIIDRLREMGYGNIVQPVNSSEKAMMVDTYHNLRAEMWATAREWMEDCPCSIPEDEQLISQLVSVGYKYDSKNRLLMQSKDEIKKDGRGSPDLADALIYTFARPVDAMGSNKIKYPDQGYV